jgi:hypothetical protein
VIYTSSDLLDDKNPMSSVTMLILVDDEHIAMIRNKLAYTNCQLISSLGLGLHIYSLGTVS